MKFVTKTECKKNLTDSDEEFKKLKDAVNNSLQRFMDEDGTLIDVNSSERSMTHALAVQFTKETFFNDWHIDCEYNRNGQRVPKTLDIPKAKCEKCNAGDSCSHNVFPDIIIHKRGKEGPNLLVIEAKKQKEDPGLDKEKIKAYIKELKYKYGLFLAFPDESTGEPDLQWWKRVGSSAQEVKDPDGKHSD